MNKSICNEQLYYYLLNKHQNVEAVCENACLLINWIVCSVAFWNSEVSRWVIIWCSHQWEGDFGSTFSFCRHSCLWTQIRPFQHSDSSIFLPFFCRFADVLQILNLLLLHGPVSAKIYLLDKGMCRDFMLNSVTSRSHDPVATKQNH